MKNPILLFTFLFFSCLVYADEYEVRDVQSFGAKGDGVTNDQDAFRKAADYFNKRGGNGMLVIPAGIYIIGKQTFTAGKNGQQCFTGEDLMHFTSVRNFVIKGQQGAVLRYMDGLRFGAFVPKTGEPYEHGNTRFINNTYAATIGTCIYIEKSDGVTVSNIELDGNSSAIILGGVYGDVGRQLPHNGVFIAKSKNVIIDSIYAHHFGLDGICVGNVGGPTEDHITLQNCTFEYNSRQGFSWIGGNGLEAKNCRFNHTGRGKFSSAPCAGMDIEAEWSYIRHGRFTDCEFINNRACSIVADSGDSGDCSFTRCTFWGVSSWSIWTVKPAFTFIGCNIYGSVVHGYDSRNDKDATKFIDCHFEDKPYNGQEPYGKFLFESNYRQRISFLNCTFVSHKKKLIWFELRVDNPWQKYQFNNCTFTIYNTNLPAYDFVAVMKGMRYKNCTFQFSKESKAFGYWIATCCGPLNTDAGGNKTIVLE